ncbi:MAG: hypothetical protein GXY58_08145 [Planctomycetaceae bacterium]|nr:hypothetical protein [Planctomycetaceae bacterium]
MAVLRSATEVWTYQDAVEHLLDVFDSDRAGRPLRMARRACHEALRELVSAHRWKYYDCRHVFQTEAPYSTGTIAYDHTGGAQERLVTLTGGTWPTSTAHYLLVISGVPYPVDQWVDATNVTLRADANPGADVAASTAYQLYRTSYPLPVGFVGGGELWDLADERQVEFVSTDEELQDSIFDKTLHIPRAASIRNDQEYLNSLSLVFTTPPSEARTFTLTYRRSPRRLITEKYSTGTVSMSAGTTTCTVSIGKFTAAHAGCIIRFGTAAAEPTNIFGGLTDTENPFSDERTIVSVASDGASCVLDSAPSAAVTAVKFTVSDPLDIEHTAMLTAYQRLAEHAYTVLTKREQKDRLERYQLARQAVLQAKDLDRRVDLVATEEDCTYLVGDVDVR